ncbi:hypothetical protein BAY61_22940 [Prauserella marina]|nr:hypothetical protein BAY61_22940 [Prauserella marina]
MSTILQNYFAHQLTGTVVVGRILRQIFGQGCFRRVRGSVRRIGTGQHESFDPPARTQYSLQQADRAQHVDVVEILHRHIVKHHQGGEVHDVRHTITRPVNCYLITQVGFRHFYTRETFQF